MGQQQRRAAAVDLVIDVDPVPIDLWHRDFLAASRRIWLRPYSSAIHATRGNAHAGKLTSRLPSGVGSRIQRQLYDKIIAATHNVDFANSLAMYEKATLKDGGIEQTNFDTYTPLRMSRVPEVAISVVANGEKSHRRRRTRAGFSSSDIPAS